MVNIYNLIPEAENEDDYLRILNERLDEMFGNKKTPQDAHFNSELLTRGKFGLKMFYLFFIVCWVMFSVSVAQHLIIYQQDSIRRCEISGLELYFNDSELSYISIGEELRFPKSQCYYQERNYTQLLILGNYTYNNIMNEIRKLGPANKLPCERVKIFSLMSADSSKTSETNVSQYDYYNIYCHHEKIKDHLMIVDFIGCFLLSMPLGILSDLYGRKNVYIISHLCLVCAVIFLLVPNIWVCLVSRCLFGTSMMNIFVVFIIFLEQSSISCRHCLGFIVYCFKPLGHLTAKSVFQKTYVYYIRVCIALVMLLPGVIFIIWYIPESPRWLYYRGHKQRAWKGITVPARFSSPFTELSKTIQKKSLCDHMRLFGKFIYRLRTYRQLFLVCSGTLVSHYFNTQRMTTQPSGRLSYSQKLSVSLFALLVTFHVAMIFFFRRTILLVAYTILVFASAVTVLQSDSDNTFIYVCNMLKESLGETCTYFIIFLTIELYPTPQRGTIAGMCLTVLGLSVYSGFALDCFLDLRKTNVTRLVTFVIATVSVSLVGFISETYDKDFPDLPREAVNARFVNIF